MRNIIQLALAQEATPGTAETLNSGDVAFRIRDEDAPSPTADTIDLQESQQSSSARPVGIGVHRFAASVSANLRPGATPLTTAPSIDLLLRMGMLQRHALKSVAIGSVTGGPFVNGEVITVGAASRGIVFRNTAAGPLRYWVTSGAIANLDTIVGETSGASADATADPTDAGFVYRPSDSDFEGGSDTKHHCTVEFLKGGFYWQGRGTLGQLQMQFRNGQPVLVRSELLGAWSAQGDKALYSVAYGDDAITPPRWVNAQMSFDGYTPRDLVDFNLSMPINLELREDANHAAAQGVRYADYQRVGSPPTVTFAPALVGTATYDFYTQFKGEATFAATWKLGSRFTFYADECQFVDVGADNRRQLAVVPLTLRLCGTNNDEFYILCE